MYAQPDAQRLMPAKAPGLKAGASKAQPIPKPAPSKMLYPSEQAGSVGNIGRAHAINAAHPNETFFTPHQAAVAHAMYRQNNPLGLLGDHVENFIGLKSQGQQLVHMFDPRTKGGIANIAGLFAGGPEGESSGLSGEEFQGMADQLGIPHARPSGEGPATRGFNKELPGQFERYSTAKAAAGGNLSHDQMLQSVAHDAWVARNHPNANERLAAIQRLHDHLFGGEVHAKGDIPPRPESAPLNEMRQNAAARRAAYEQRTAERAKQPQFDAAFNKEQRTNAFLKSNNIRGIRSGDPFGSQLHEDLTFDHLGRGPAHPDYQGEHPGRLGPGEQGSHDALGLHAQRQAALARFYRQQLHNHLN